MREKFTNVEAAAEAFVHEKKEKLAAQFPKTSEKLGEVRAEIKKEQQKAPVLALVVGLVISANLCCIGCLCVVCGLSPHLMARSRGFRSAGSHDDEGVALRPQGRAPPSADEEAVE